MLSEQLEELSRLFAATPAMSLILVMASMTLNITSTMFVNWNRWVSTYWLSKVSSKGRPNDNLQKF